ncbi:unnamed protein product [Peniophora sp. CBMAI 1063]|nr:unnamed protein product [Peniophora sp. CBMAI 1063]
MASTGILSLKNDTLFELFALVAATDPPHALPWGDPGPLKYHIGWVRLSHVCRLWRKLLVDEMPSLWARIACRLPRALDTVLSRAQDQPLILTTDITWGSSLRLPPKHDLHDRLYELCITHITRAGNLDAQNVSMDWVGPLSGKYLPLLKKIDAYHLRPWGDQTPTASLFPLDAPNLKSVRLRDIAVTFTSQSIRELTLNGREIFSHEQWSLIDVLGSLRTSLEFLELEMRPPKAINWRAQATAPFTLERLKHIHLYGSGNANLTELVTLLGVTVPLEDHNYYAHLEPEGWERFVYGFGPILRQPSFNALHLTDDGRVFASTFVAIENPEHYPSSASQEASLEVEYAGDGARAKAITTGLLKHLEHPCIEQIIFATDAPDERLGDIRDALRPFEAVTSFAALSHHSLKVLRAGDDDHGPILPSLSLLVASMEEKYGDDKWDAESLKAWWDMLCDILEDRVRAGLTAPRIRLCSNATPIAVTEALKGVDEEGLARLKELVPGLEDTRKIFEAAKKESP